VKQTVFSTEHRTWALLIILIPILAVLITWLTGFWAPIQIYEYGFPLSWKGCLIIPTVSGGNACSSNTYDWNFFLLDLVFYAAIGYGIVFLYARLPWKQKDHVVDPDKGS